MMAAMGQCMTSSTYHTGGNTQFFLELYSIILLFFLVMTDANLLLCCGFTSVCNLQLNSICLLKYQENEFSNANTDIFT